jgi:predicted dienelactone hydrolase
VWYPAKRGTHGTRPYLATAEASVQGPAMARNFNYGAHDLDHLDQVIAHSVEGAEPARARERFPILIFNHGYECYPAQNTALNERLASHGYIVISLGHPHDAADFRLSDGTLVSTSHPAGNDPEFAAHRKTLQSPTTHDARTAALKGYAEAQSRDRIGASWVAWRDDLTFTTLAVVAKKLPSPVLPVLATGDTKRLAFIGMSFGGATAASACNLVEQCRAAINLDGGNYDPALFNASVNRPLLLLMSDWVHLPLPNRPSDPDFAPNDYAYEPWAKAGLDPNVVRLRLDGIRHMGFTDLILLMNGPEHEARFGTIEPRVAVAAIGDASLAFLDEYLKGGSRKALDSVVARTPALRVHAPESVRHWAAAADANLCTDPLPQSLRQQIQTRYPGGVLPSISDFTTMHLEPFETLGQQCPALAMADVDGDGTQDFGLLVQLSDGDTVLLVARGKKTGWLIDLVAHLGKDRRGDAYVSAINAGRYEDRLSKGIEPAGTEPVVSRVRSYRAKAPGFVAGDMQIAGATHAAFFHNGRKWVYLRVPDARKSDD